MLDTPAPPAPAFDFKLYVLDVMERAGTTLVQSLIVFLPVLLAGHHDSNLAKAILAAVIPAVFSVVLNAIMGLKPELLLIKNFYLDMFVRALKTFLVGVLGAASATGFNLFDASKWRVIAIGALVTAASVIKSAIASKLSKPTVTPASLLPKTAAA